VTTDSGGNQVNMAGALEVVSIGVILLCLMARAGQRRQDLDLRGGGTPTTPLSSPGPRRG
jgi:hypothetical protein